MSLPHICICLCTARRPALLAALLERLQKQRSDGRFTHAIVVVDNDPARSAAPVAARFAGASVPVRYAVEPLPNIARARNRSIGLARGDLLAFIDDDELPADDWLLVLLDALDSHAADGVLGPVVPAFACDPPRWLTRGRFHEKSGPASGALLGWRQTRTSNALLRMQLFADARDRFDERFDKGGEDVDLFRRLIARGARFVWCAEAPVTEIIPAERCTRRYLLRRALLRGQGTVKYAAFGAGDVLRSALALPGYALALPVSLLLGQHRAMQVLTRTAEHAARLLALAGIELVKRY